MWKFQNLPIKDVPFIIFDTETTGRYPIESELCELAAVKWINGEVKDRFQTLIRPKSIMSEEVISIHHITNEMVVNAPSIEEKIKEFYNFLSEGVPVAHHIPFDLGFLAYEFEKNGLPLLNVPCLCTSLLSRVHIPESENHRMVTLVNLLGIDGGQAHRAEDDTLACLGVLKEIIKRIGPGKNLNSIYESQNVILNWKDYSIQNLKSHRVYSEIISALLEKRPVEIVYTGGSRPGQARTVFPIGLVRNHLGDFLIAKEEVEGTSKNLEETPKRYYLNKIKAARS